MSNTKCTFRPCHFPLIYVCISFHFLPFVHSCPSIFLTCHFLPFILAFISFHVLFIFAFMLFFMFQSYPFIFVLMSFHVLFMIACISFQFHFMVAFISFHVPVIFAFRFFCFLFMFAFKSIFLSCIYFRPFSFVHSCPSMFPSFVHAFPLISAKVSWLSKHTIARTWLFEHQSNLCIPATDCPRKPNRIRPCAGLSPCSGLFNYPNVAAWKWKERALVLVPLSGVPSSQNRAAALFHFSHGNREDIIPILPIVQNCFKLQ